jgi:methylmalonyl-CoA mutase C-terminal domain/subunit
MVLASGLRDEGFEVIYTGLRQTPEGIVKAAMEEDVDVVGLSCLSGSHNYYFSRVVELLRERGMNDILVIGGGIIPDEDIPYLREKGISACFGPGTCIKDVATFIREHMPMRE